MGLSTLLRTPTARVCMIVLAVLGSTLGFSGSVSAGEEAFGNAFAITAEGLVDIDPEPEATFPSGGQDTTIEVDLGGLLLACTLNASSRGFDSGGSEVDNVAAADEVVSSASVETATLLGVPDADCDGGDDGVGGGDLFDFLDDLVDDILGGSGLSLTAIASQCAADEDGASGTSTLVGLDDGGDIVDDLLGDGLDLNDLALDLGLDLGVDLGILELELDEQVMDPDGNGITVRALRLTLLPGDGDGDPLQEVILAESRCRFVGDDEPDEPDDDGDKLAGNDSDVSNNSDGSAVIETGDATAVGNAAQTEINQSATAGDGSGDAGGGVALVDQDASVDNAGDAAANTGENTAVGNDSTNVAGNDQVAVGDGGGNGGTKIADNSSSVSNSSDGTAEIDTGDATAVGNVSDTEINQVAQAGDSDRDCGEDACAEECPESEETCLSECREPDGDACEDEKDDDCAPWCNYGWGGRGSGGVSSTDQSATVSNRGSASANTGGNTAVGNSSNNTASNSQTASVDD